MSASDYYTTKDGYILRTSDGAMIPQDPDNGDFQIYQTWLAAGNTATAYVPPQGN